MFNPYIHEKLAQTHRQELLHEAEQQRMLTQLPQHHSSVMQNVARQLAAFLMHLAFFIKKVELSKRTATGQL